MQRGQAWVRLCMRARPRSLPPNKVSSSRSWCVVHLHDVYCGPHARVCNFFVPGRSEKAGCGTFCGGGKSFLTHCNAVATSWRIPVGHFYNQWTGLAAVRPATLDTVHDESSSRLSQYRVSTTSKKPWQKRSASSVQISSVHDAYVLKYCTAYRARLQLSTGVDATPAAPPPPPNDSALRGVGCQPSVRRGNPPRLSDESTTAPRARVCRPRSTELAVLGPLIQYLVQIRDGSDAAEGHLG